MELDLKGKRALVGGSSQGIGKAIAIALAKLGADITLIARNEESLKAVLNELDSRNGQTHDYLVADFFQPEQVKNTINNYLNSGKQIHILINNTGGPKAGQAIDASAEEFKQAFDAHVICNQILTQAVVPGMKKAGFGRIINVISTSVKIPIQGLGVSNTIRGAVASWSKTMANELGAFGITVNNVLPGFTKTSRLDSLIEGKSKKLSASIEAVEENMKSSIPAGRFGSAEEVANVAAFLASPAASYVNGVNIPVDGGRTGSM
jgi:3-oxoacyl-[acyl-carrier protein] reductase